MKHLRLAFFGSPDFGVPALEALVAAGHDVVAVYTQPPRPSGRGHRMTPCPVNAAAHRLGLPVRTPDRLRGNRDEWDFFERLSLDAAVVAAYGLILPLPMLAAPRRGCLNIHASLLPRWRGAAPIQAAIQAGDEVTGITIMQMDEGLDTGPMLASGRTEIGSRDTARDVHDRLAAMGAVLIERVLEEAPAPIAQPDTGATYAGKLTRTDGAIDWSRGSIALDRMIRALTPWPGTRTSLPGPAGAQPIVKIVRATPVDASGEPGLILDDLLTVGCGAGALRLDSVQAAGRSPTDGRSFMHGHRLEPGMRLGSTAP
jgi:methionyl-tRNA formyltransferase